MTPENPIAPRRSSTAVRATTTTVTTASARMGNERRSSIVASQRGSSPRRAIASVVRDTPGIRLSSTPRAAMPAPIRTTGASWSSGDELTTRASGAPLSAMPATGSAARTVMPTIAYTASTPVRARGIAFGMVVAGSRTSSPSVAILA